MSDLDQLEGRLSQIPGMSDMIEQEKRDLNGWYGGVNWGHVQPGLCITCGGRGVIGGFRWKLCPDKGVPVKADEIPCPSCKGTGRAGHVGK